ncbi:transcription factor, RsfA family [Schinkia azotoformans MEV2011]|uniref:Transcription factor, RsfA family n=1 Tax=Schinkia azotoformans MEV2011 TaxID=1348973 RepID=A0A072P1M7_SCHAZ|nr:RsfA family transcriptional regulator [Schinkia azotoformans]KEF39395.1 transcription factor, RsfA family [Schinkia azotoformans MEV2011]MEC1694853.1 RsfA family transcriptional regulator [Schinkia azotoformans]MEC1715703.1 RsfA family transcriptional regulator [Schinkia azotoformans]MEC1726687.1 RsfA family transcriptional regulator [Schinkia azotoformans]MEC1742245.1 RsfA family transcriptional regulator [Schinkia azotoformans]
MKIRQDAWSHEDDLLLAETVLRHIREGSTQLNAFEEVGDKLNRTSAACGFRWNAEVRKKYYQAMELAKKQRKDRKRALAGQSQQYINHNHQSMVNEVSVPAQMTAPAQAKTVETVFDYTTYNNINTTNELLTRQVEIKEEFANEINLDSVISYLYSVKNLGMNSQILQSENERLNRENRHLLEEKEKIERTLQRLKQENIVIQEDYQALVQIMDRARRMVSFTDPNNLNNDDFGQIAK